MTRPSKNDSAEPRLDEVQPYVERGRVPLMRDCDRKDAGTCTYGTRLSRLEDFEAKLLNAEFHSLAPAFR